MSGTSVHISALHADKALRELQSFWADRSQFAEVWVSRADGASACALINDQLAWIMFLRDPDDAGFSTRNLSYRGPSDATLDFVLGNGQRDRYPACWLYPADAVRRALEVFVRHGAFPHDIAWHNDSGDGATPPLVHDP